jgi:hypothetical protein
MVLNYLHSEQRPEKSLKALAQLFGITKYDPAKSLKHHRYCNAYDPDLHHYNHKDTWATLLTVERLEERIGEEFRRTEKLEPFCKWWYYRLFWTCLGMTEDGIAFDHDRLEELDFQLTCRAALLYSECRHIHGFLASGTGSDGSKLELYVEALEEAGLTGDIRVEKTPTRGDVSVNRKNASLLMENLEPGSPTYIKIRQQQRFEALQKAVTSYTRPMLYGTKRNPIASRLLPLPEPRPVTMDRPVLLAYPTWYPVPSTSDAGVEGGTIQGRITSKGPALQTLPKRGPGSGIFRCLTSRYHPGFLVMADLSQIEMRMAALLSGDPLMMAEYRAGVDRHTKTAKEICKQAALYMQHMGFEKLESEGQIYTPERLLNYVKDPEPKVTDPDGFKLWRYGGKTCNFLIIYHGHAKRLQMTFADDLGIVLPIEVCEAIISEQISTYSRLWSWQEELIQMAKKFHRIELPLTGQSRVFLGSDKGIEWTYLSEITNFPVQCPAANVMLDYQYNLKEGLRTLKRRVYLGLNVYDAVTLDGPMSQFSVVVDRILPQAFGHSEYLERLQDRLERQVPIEYDVEVLLRDDPQQVLAA